MPNLICPHCFAPFAGGRVQCTACGATLENQNPDGALPFGALVAEQYIIGKVLQIDGEGIVYQAVEQSSAQPVQIKEYLPITLSEDRAPDGTVNAKQGSGVMFKTTRMDFAELYLSLKNNTNVAGLHQVLDVVQDNNTAYAILAPLQGVSLSEYIKEMTAGKISPEKACKLLAPVVTGLEVLHGAGIVHRGISPENMVVQPNGKLCLTGYATIGLRTIGSALRPQLYEGYSAPEQYATAEFEGRYTDVYCLAAVYYFLVTGQAPVSAGQRLVVEFNPTARSISASVSRTFSDVLAHALRMRPAERMQTVGELADCLANPETGRELLLAVRRAKQKKARRGVTGVMGLLLVGIAVLLCLVAWLFISFRLGESRSEPDVAPEPTATLEPTAAPIYVDNFVGRLYSQLVSTTVYNDKYLFYVVSEEYSDEVAGTVLRQSPAAGEALGEDVTVQLVVSKGPEMVTVPQIFGFTQDSAASELEAVGLTASFVMKVNDGSYASGCVIKTDPELGAEVQTGTTVTVYIAADRDVSVISVPENENETQASEEE